MDVALIGRSSAGTREFRRRRRLNGDLLTGGHEEPADGWFAALIRPWFIGT